MWWFKAKEFTHISNYWINFPKIAIVWTWKVKIPNLGILNLKQTEPLSNTELRTWFIWCFQMNILFFSDQTFDTISVHRNSEACSKLWKYPDMLSMSIMIITTIKKVRINSPSRPQSNNLMKLDCQNGKLVQNCENIQIFAPMSIMIITTIKKKDSWLQRYN